LAFILGAFLRVREEIEGKIQAIIVCHTRELVLQTTEFAKKVLPWLKVNAYLPETKNPFDCQILVATHGLITNNYSTKIDLSELAIVIIDEVDYHLDTRGRPDPRLVEMLTHMKYMDPKRLGVHKKVSHSHAKIKARNAKKEYP